MFSKKQDSQLSLEYDYYILDNNQVQFNFYYKIPYSNLIFKKNDIGFVSSLTSSIKINNSNSELVYSKSFSDEVLFKLFNDTQTNEEKIFSNEMLN